AISSTRDMMCHRRRAASFGVLDGGTSIPIILARIASKDSLPATRHNSSAERKIVAPGGTTLTLWYVSYVPSGKRASTGLIMLGLAQAAPGLRAQFPLILSRYLDTFSRAFPCSLHKG